MAMCSAAVVGAIGAFPVLLYRCASMQAYLVVTTEGLTAPVVTMDTTATGVAAATPPATALPLITITVTTTVIMVATTMAIAATAAMAVIAGGNINYTQQKTKRGPHRAFIIFFLQTPLLFLGGVARQALCVAGPGRSTALRESSGD